MPSRANFLIVHGAYGSPDENWFPWLRNELQKIGNVFVPQFPTPEEQNLDAWLAIADQALAGCEPQNTILIGHSSGAALVLRMAERSRQPFKAIFAVCPFARELGNKFDALNTTFLHPAFDWKGVRRGAEAIICYAGDDDPYVPLPYSAEIAKALDVELIPVKKGGHLNAAAGYRTFPGLLHRICQLSGQEPL